MISKDAILNLMLRECDLCVHLHGKVPEGKMDYRFTPKQRSTEELLRYISYVGLGASRSIAAGNWEPYQALVKESEGQKASDFSAAMERQKEGLKAFFAGLTEKDLEEKTFEMPWGERLPLGQGILALPYAALAAYRMQLFLQAKAAGNLALSTSNNWAGRDMAPPK